MLTIGNKYSDSKVQNDIKLWPFKVERSQTDNCLINVQMRRLIYNIDHSYSNVI